MIKKLIIIACILATQLVGAQSNQKTSTLQKQPIQLSVRNNTDQEIIIAARYALLPPKDSTLIGMPNPFVFVEVPAHKTISADFKRRGDGRLGGLIEIIFRTKDHHAFKTFTQEELDKTAAEDVIMITVDNEMLPQ